MSIIQKQAETAAKKMGLTRAQVIDAANTFGTFGKAAGLTGQELAGFSTQMTQLASDLSSFKGGSPEEAIQAIGAAMRGEAEPIRRYGVLLDDATLKARALKMGLIDSTKEALTPANKTLAAQAEILAQSTDAMGDFERTQFSTANTAKAFDATMVNFKTTLGSLVAPAFSIVKSASTGVLDKFSGDLESVAPKVEAFWNNLRVGVEVLKTGDFKSIFAEEFGVSEDTPIVAFALKLRDSFAQVGPALDNVKAQLAPVIEAIGGAFKELLPAVAELAPQVINIAGAFSPLGLAFKALLPVMPTLVQAFANIAKTLLGSLKPVLPVITQMISQMASIFAAHIARVLPIIVQLVAKLAQVFADLIAGLMPAIQALMPIIVKLFAAIADAVQVILPALMPLIDAVIGAISSLTPIVTQVAQVLVEIVGIVIDALTPILPVIADLIRIVAETFTGLVTAITPVIAAIGNALIPIFEALKPVVERVFGYTRDYITTVINTVKNVLALVMNVIQGNWSEVWNSMKNGVTTVLTAVVGFVRNLPSRILAALGNIGSLLYNAGASVIQGFLDGISSMFGSVKEKLGALTSWLPDWKGPAPVDAKILYGSGRLVMQGFQKGLEDSYGGIQTSLNGFTHRLNPVLPNSPYSVNRNGSAPLAVYVQNPFTGDYLLAQVDSRTDGKLAGGSRLRVRELAGV